MRMPTRAEFDVLIALWRRGPGPATGRQITAAHDGSPSFSTVMNHLTHLHLKKLAAYVQDRREALAFGPAGPCDYSQAAP